jgi:CheY-like chemotaxis protein/nitrogen-specific signal transduction histidine kinase
VDKEPRKTLEQSRALSDALSAAEAANKAKTVFFSNMSHEIRTPMNAIIGLDRIALNDDTLSDTTREYLEKIGSSADHLLLIINDILDMSRIEAGRMVLHEEAFSLEELLEQIDVMIKGQCSEKGLAWDARHKNSGGTFVGDDTKLKQVLINILGNSVKFTPKGGSVSFTSERTAEYENSAAFRFVMKDTGIGMNPEYLPRLFEPFSQEDPSTKTKFGSTGLGMSITKSIVEMMDGDITVESKKNEGTTFTVTVTLLKASSEEEDAVRKAKLAESDAGEEKISLQGLRVLLAEDIEINAEIAKMILSSEGMETEHALNGKEAVEMYEKNPPHYYDAILMDMRMPEMDGLEATRFIRAMDKLDAKTIPIIALTANAFQEDVQRSLQAGLNAHLSKPIEPNQLKDTLRELIFSA